MDLTPVDTEVVEARTMDFPDAIRQIMLGRKVTRISWGNEDYGLLKEGWLTIYTKGSFHTWTVSEGDFEGNDWVII